MNFNIRTVLRSEGYCAVHHKLHIAGAARLGRCKGYLLADICRRNHKLRHCHPVVLKEEYFKLIVYRAVVIDNG